MQSAGTNLTPEEWNRNKIEAENAAAFEEGRWALLSKEMGCLRAAAETRKSSSSSLGGEACVLSSVGFSTSKQVLQVNGGGASYGTWGTIW